MANTIEIVIKATDDASKVIAKLQGDVTASTGLLIKKFDDVGKAAQTADQKLQSFGKGLSSLGDKMSIGVTLPLVAAGTAAIKFASDLNETTSKVGVLFGDMSADMQKWASTASTSFGLSKKAALDGASDFAIFGKSAGLAGKDLTEFSKQNVKLASDMASFFNTSPEEAITAIGAAFRGESEPIRRYGVLLNEASLQQEALRQGLIRTTTQALTPQQRILAASALIMQQTGAAQGDFARTSDQLANSMRIAKAQLEDAAAALGTNLLPIVTKGIGVVNGLFSAFQQLSPEMQNVILAAGGIAAALGPVMSISGRLIGVFLTLKGGAIDAARSISAFGKDVGDVAVYLKDAGISAGTLKDSLQYLRAGGALLAGELAIIVAGLIAVAKYLEEVNAASKATNETLIDMSHSGDVFKQAAATTEIFANGQKRLKDTLDGVNESLKMSAESYADYRAGVEGAAKAAGYQIDENGNLIQSLNGMAGAQQKVIQSNYALTESEYAANKALHERGGLLDRGLQGLIDLSREVELYNAKQRAGVNSTEELYRATNALNQGIRNQAGVYAVLDAAMDKTTAKSNLLASSQTLIAGEMADLKTAMAGAIKNEDQQYSNSQAELQKRLKETADELKNLEGAQGSVDKSTVKNAMSAAQLAKAHADLAAAQARLSAETDPAKQQQLAASIAVQQEKIAGANQAVVTYVDNSKKIAELKGQYDDINKEIEANAKAHEDATRRILFGYAEQQLAVGGLTETEAKALDALAVRWGLKSKEDVTAMQAIRDAALGLAKDNNINAFVGTVDRAAGEAGTSFNAIAGAADNARKAIAKAGVPVEIPITPKTDTASQTAFNNAAKNYVTNAVPVPLTPKTDPAAQTAFQNTAQGYITHPVEVPVNAKAGTVDAKTAIGAAGIPIDVPVTPKLTPGAGEGVNNQVKGFFPGGIQVPLVPKIDPADRTKIGHDLLGDLKFTKPTIKPELDYTKVKQDFSKFFNLPDVKKVQEPLVMAIKADTSSAITSMQYFSSYGLSPAVTYYDALIARASLFSTIVGQTPTLPTLPGTPTTTTPTTTTPTRPPGTGPAEFATGADFIVPPGYPGDSFPMRVSSGERVQVTPAGQGGGGNLPPINITQTFNGAQSSPEQYRSIMYEVITDVFDKAMRQ